MKPLMIGTLLLLGSGLMASQAQADAGATAVNGHIMLAQSGSSPDLVAVNRTLNDKIDMKIVERRPPSPSANDMLKPMAYYLQAFAPFIRAYYRH